MWTKYHFTIAFDKTKWTSDEASIVPHTNYTQLWTIPDAQSTFFFKISKMFLAYNIYPFEKPF